MKAKFVGPEEGDRVPLELLESQLGSLSEEVQRIDRDSETIHVKKVYKDEGEVLDEEETSEVLAVREFVTETAQICLKASNTVNMGKFSSVKVAVEVRLPCYVEEVEGALNKASMLVDKRLSRETIKGQDRVRALQTPKSSTPF